jgi:hypothetical protein
VVGDASARDSRAASDEDIRSPPLLDRIPLYSQLYGGVYGDGLVTCCLSLPPPFLQPQVTCGFQVERGGRGGRRVGA